METNDKAAEPNPKTPAAAVAKQLKDLVALSESGELQALVVGFVKVDGSAAVQSTPMSPVMMNHLSTLLERRVAREYDRALAQAPARPGTGAGPVPETARNHPVAKLPRKVRRQVEKAQRKMAQTATKKTTAQPIIRSAWPGK